MQRLNEVTLSKLQKNISKAFYGYIIENFNEKIKGVFFSNSIDSQDFILSEDVFSNYINLAKLNDIRYLNSFIANVNNKLPIGGKFMGRVETKKCRKQAILQKYNIYAGYLIYILDYIFKRMAPKLWFSRKLYFYLTKGRNQVFSMAEIFGRLKYNGFDIESYLFKNSVLYFVAEKRSRSFKEKELRYGPLISLNRVGKEGRVFKVYKIRTMYPYSEYLQEYVYNQNKLERGGKIKNDFRISYEGKFFRKYWLDELPMIYNFCKGEIKIVGVRPISEHYLSLYNNDLVKLRRQVRPGFIPPFYVDLPQTLDEIMDSEKKYLESYIRSPLKTDFIYFNKAIFNVFFNRIRSA